MACLGVGMGSFSRLLHSVNLTTLDSMLVGAQHIERILKHTCGMPPIDQNWFKEKLKSIGVSQRQLAKKMGLDPASVSYMLSGKRRMTMDEAHAIAGYLLLPVTEVMRQAGIEVLDDVRKVPIAGFIGQHCMVTLLPKGTHDLINAPADVPTGSYVLQLRIVNSPQDGWLYYVDGAQGKPEESLDKLCLVAFKDGGLILAIVRRGYKKDLFNLLVTCDSSVLENRELVWTARVLWIQPS